MSLLVGLDYVLLAFELLEAFLDKNTEVTFRIMRLHDAIIEVSQHLGSH